MEKKELGTVAEKREKEETEQEEGNTVGEEASGRNNCALKDSF